jgi:hypothetical protein
MPVGAALAESAGAGHSAAVTICNETWTGWLHLSDNEAGASWDANSCGWQIRGEVKCATGRYHNGGWVRKVGLVSWADCGNGVHVSKAYAQWWTGPGPQ